MNLLKNQLSDTVAFLNYEVVLAKVEQDNAEGTLKNSEAFTSIGHVALLVH